MPGHVKESVTQSLNIGKKNGIQNKIQSIEIHKTEIMNFRKKTVTRSRFLAETENENDPTA